MSDEKLVDTAINEADNNFQRVEDDVKKAGFGEWFFLLSQLGVVCIYTFFCSYDPTILPGDDTKLLV